MQRIEPTPPNDDASEFGEILFVARSDLACKMVFLLGGGLSVGTAALLWGEFSQRFGSLAGWALTLWHNPLVAAPGLIVIVAAVAGIWWLLRFVYYLRVRVEVCQDGIRITPGSRRTRWDEVDEIYYARRRLRPTGAGMPKKVSLQLRSRRGKRVNLPHRFREMEKLVSIVRDSVEPLLLERARRTLELEGSVSFGRLVTVAREGILLGRSRKALPFDRIKRCGVSEGEFLVLNRADKLVFTRAVELIPSVTVIGPLVDGMGALGSEYR